MGTFSYRITDENSIMLSFFSNSESMNGKTVQLMYPIKSHLHYKLIVVYIYEKGYNRQHKYVTYLQFWERKNTWFLKPTIILGTIILYLIRKRAKLGMGLCNGFLDVLIIFFGGGNIQSQHKWEKMFFSILMVAAFFWVSIYSANFSMHSTISDDFWTVSTFKMLAKQNVTFYLTRSVIKEQSIITQMLQ